MKRKPKVGDTVTCLIAMPAYYSGYCGRPEINFEPGMVGTVAVIAPKVMIVKGEGKDGLDEFLVVDFLCPPHGQQRVGLNFCNARIVEAT